jgi:hypothetical protein
MRSKACYRTAGIESWYGVRVNNIMSSHTPRIRGTINITQCTRASRCNFYVVPPPLYDQVRKQRLQKTHTPKHQHVPLLVIYNKYDPEWRGPVNFINPDVLKMIINEYQTVCPGGEVIYDRPGSPRSLAQGATGVVTDAGSMGTLQMSSNIDGKNVTDEEMLSTFPFVSFMPDHLALQGKMHSISINEGRLRAIAQAQCYIGVQGGLSNAYFYMGGQHVILHRMGKETYGPSFKALAGENASKSMTIRVANRGTSLIEHMKQMIRTEDGQCACHRT